MEKEEASGVRPPRGAPPPFLHPLSSAPRAPGGAGGPPRAGPGRTPAPNVRGSLELCGGAAGVGARGGVHVGREGVAESGRCPVRPPLE